MLNASALAFIVAGSRWGEADGQIMFIMILTLAAAEVAIGLGLIIQMFRQFKTIDINVLSDMKGEGDSANARFDMASTHFPIIRITSAGIDLG